MNHPLLLFRWVRTPCVGWQGGREAKDSLWRDIAEPQLLETKLQDPGEEVNKPLPWCLQDPANFQLSSERGFLVLKGGSLETWRLPGQSKVTLLTQQNSPFFPTCSWPLMFQKGNYRTKRPERRHSPYKAHTKLDISLGARAHVNKRMNYQSISGNTPIVVSAAILVFIFQFFFLLISLCYTAALCTLPSGSILGDHSLCVQPDSAHLQVLLSAHHLFRAQDTFSPASIHAERLPVRGSFPFLHESAIQVRPDTSIGNQDKRNFLNLSHQDRVLGPFSAFK